MSAHTNNPVFSAEQDVLLAVVLDEIIPPGGDGKFPGAGELGLAGYIEQALQQTPQTRSVITQGLAGLDERAHSRNAQGFAALSKQDKLQVLNELASADQSFFLTLIFQTYVGYYHNGRVLEALGLEPRPPHPKGYEMEANDLTLLDAVRRRPKLYREC